MARSIQIEILGDAASYERALNRSSHATSGFGSVLGRLGKTAIVAGAAVAAGVVYGLDKSIKAAEAAQVSQARLDQAFKNVGTTMAAHAKQIENLTAKGRELGFSDAEQRDALGSLITATKNYGSAAKDVGVAEDVARFKHIGLSDASKMLTMAMTGSQRAAKQLGITVMPLTTHLDALKASHVNLKDAAGKALEAHAKLLDKMATGQAVIQAVTDRVKGQAEAFSGTSAGAMARYHAELTHLEATIGDAFLPILDKVVTKLSDWIDALNRSSTFHTVLKQAVYGLGIAFTALGTAISVASAFIRDHWTQIQAAAMTLKNTVMTAVDAMIAIWQVFGPTVTKVVQAFVGAIVPMIRGAMQIIRGIFEVISGLLHGDWSKAWQGIQDITRGALTYISALIKGWVGIIGAIAGDLGSAIVKGITAGLKGLYGALLAGLHGIEQAISQAVANAFAAAQRVGAAIIHGVVSGLTGLAGEVGHAISSGISAGISAAGKVLHGSGDFQATKHLVGKPLAEGVILGFIEGIKELPDRMNIHLKAALVDARVAFEAAAKVLGHAGAMAVVDGFRTPTLEQQIKQALEQAVQQALAAARQKVADARSAFETAFGNLASAALAAFDAKVAAWVNPLQAKLDAMQLEDQIRQLNEAVNDANAAVDTAAQAMAAAQAAVQSAISAGPNAGETPEQFKARIAALQAAQDDAVAAWHAAQKAAYDAGRALEEFNVQQEAIAAQKAHDAKMAKQRVYLQDQLDQLEKWLEKHPKAYTKMHEKIMALFEKFNLDYKKWGKSFGDAIAQGLHEAAGEVEKQAQALASAVAAYVKLPGAGAPTSGNKVGLPGTKGGPKIPHLAAGGIVRSATLAMIGERGPEAVMPLGSMRAGGDTHFHIQGGTFFGTNMDAATRDMIDSMRRHKRRSGLELGLA